MLDSRLGRTVRASLKPALKTAWWLTKLTLPITLVITILKYLGVIAWVAAWCAPFFEGMGLPGQSSLVFITSAFSTLYASIAVIATLGFDYRSAVILAVMSLICHNLIIESAVQQKTGTPGWAMAVLRIGMALLAGWLMNGVLPAGLDGRLLLPDTHLMAPPASWGEMFVRWVRTLVPLCLRMSLIVVALNILQDILREYKITDLLALSLRPLMALFGLPRSTSFLWIIGNLVGLAYGGAALIEEVKRGEVSSADARLLNTHLAVSHSLLEDTTLFTSIGIGLVWLMIPRLLLAIAAVWTLRVFSLIFHRLAPRPVADF